MIDKEDRWAIVAGLTLAAFVITLVVSIYSRHSITCYESPKDRGSPASQIVELRGSLWACPNIYNGRDGCERMETCE